MSGCEHEPRCSRDPSYCWTPAYVSAISEGIRAEGRDPVVVAAVRGRGLAARVCEHIDQKAAR